MDDLQENGSEKMDDPQDNALDKMGELPANAADNAIYTFPGIWDAFQSFENMATRKRGENLEDFLSQWKENMRIAQSAGCDYSDTILACKLLQKLNLERRYTKNMVNSMAFCPSEMLSSLLTTLEDYPVDELESKSEQSIKSELMEKYHSQNIKVEYPESDDNLFMHKPFGQSEEELLLNIELKEKLSEEIRRNFQFDLAKAMGEAAEDAAAAGMSKEHEFDDDDEEEPKPKIRRKRKPAERNYKCTECNYSAVRASDLTRHFKRHSGEKLFKCTACDKSFGKKKSLNYHFERKHTMQFNYKCSQCNYAAVRQSELDRHFRRHTGEKPFKCILCEKAFGEKKALKYHFERAHSNEPSYKCTECNYWTPESSRMTIHLRTHGDKNIFKCKLCEKTFSGTKLLKRHMEIKHKGAGEDGNESKLLIDGENEFEATQARDDDQTKPLKTELESPFAHDDSKVLVVMGAAAVKEQKEKKKVAGRLQCEHCGKELSGVGALRVHYRSCPNLDPEERKLKGSKCNYVRKKVKFTCEVCQKVVIGQSNFSNHLSLHSSERNFICDMCPATFTSSYHLNFHKYRHKKGKWRQCDSCDKTFSATGDLKRHIMRMHTDERPFQCPHCAFTTVAKFYLDRHMRSHTGETPFKCNLCGKSYRDKKSVKRHITAHHGFYNDMYIGRNLAPPKIQDDTKLEMNQV